MADDDRGPESSVRMLIDERARGWPDRAYVVDDGRTITIDSLSLLAACRAVGALLVERGAAPGAHIAVVLPNSLVAVKTLLGVLYGGWVVCPIDPHAPLQRMRHVLEHSDAALVIVSSESEPTVRQATSGIGRPITVVICDDRSPWWKKEGASVPAIAPRPADPALLMYTSGTTSNPKGVLLSHASLAYNARRISQEHALGPDDRVAAVLPLWHINGFVVTMLSPLAHGGSLVMPSRFSSSGFWSTVGRHGCTWINLVPTMIAYLVDGPVPATETLRVRFCRSASSPLSPEQHVAFERKFGIGIIETMGLTETAAPVFSNPFAKEARKLGSIGRASGVEARVVDPAGRDVPNGTQGEIVVRGPSVMLGYYKDSRATADAFLAGRWLRTGDLGCRDEDGFFVVTGRLKEILIKGGENIAPREIDEVARRHPAVLDAAAVGIPDAHYGQDILLCVVLRPDYRCDESSLRAFCAAELGRFKTPRVIHFLKELPRGPSGKVQRWRLAGIGAEICPRD